MIVKNIFSYLLDKPNPNKVWVVYWNDDYDTGGIEDIYDNPDDAWNSIYLKNRMTGLSYLVTENSVEGTYTDQVWIVTWSNYVENGIEKIFPSEIEAKKYMKHRDKMTGLHYSMGKVVIQKKQKQAS